MFQCSYISIVIILEPFLKQQKPILKEISSSKVIVCKLDENRETLLQGKGRGGPGLHQLGGFLFAPKAGLEKPKGFKVETKNYCSM